MCQIPFHIFRYFKALQTVNDFPVHYCHDDFHVEHGLPVGRAFEQIVFGHDHIGQLPDTYSPQIMVSEGCVSSSQRIRPESIMYAELLLWVPSAFRFTFIGNSRYSPEYSSEWRYIHYRAVRTECQDSATSLHRSEWPRIVHTLFAQDLMERMLVKIILWHMLRLHRRYNIKLTKTRYIGRIDRFKMLYAVSQISPSMPPVSLFYCIEAQSGSRIPTGMYSRLYARLMEIAHLLDKLLRFYHRLASFPRSIGIIFQHIS